MTFNTPHPRLELAQSGVCTSRGLLATPRLRHGNALLHTMAMISPLIRVSPKIAFVSDDSVLVKEPIEKRGEELLRAPENCALIAEIETSLADAQVTLALELLKNRELLEDASLLPSEVTASPSAHHTASLTSQPAPPPPGRPSAQVVRR